MTNWYTNYKFSSLSDIIKESKNPLFFFPFNSFGNMNSYSNVLQSVKKIKNSDFIIFSYKTDEKSTKERFKYYNNCNYDNLSVSSEDIGIRFTANNGLNSMAYDEEYLKKFINKLGMSVNLKRFSDIGVAYFIDTREKELER